MGFFTNFVKMFGASGTYHKEAKLFHGEVSHVMGTKFDLVIHGSEEIVATALWREVCADLEKYERMLDRFDPSSELSLVNEGKAVPSEELESLIVLSDEYRMKTGGCFDITKGSTERGKVQYDFGGFAKGFVLRLALDKVKQAGAGCVLADFGQSSFFALGGHPLGGSWKASLKSPYSGAVLREIDIVDGALSVSGNTPGYCGHIIDPRTGESVISRKMVVVSSPDPLDAEVLSTALMVAGENGADSMMRCFQGAAAEFYEL